MRSITITPLDVMKPLFASLAVNALIISLWTGLSPLYWTREVSTVDEFNRTVMSHGFCTSKGFIPYIVVLVGANVGLLSLALYQVYHARDISTEFAESE